MNEQMNTELVEQTEEVQVVDWKSVVIFLAIAFGLAWIFFLLPLVFGEPGTSSHQMASTFSYMLAMWMPGVAAIAVTLIIKKAKFGTLGLRRLGPKRYYLWAWVLFPVLAVLAGLLTALFGLGELDLEFTAIRESMAAMPEGSVPMGLLVVVQILGALTVGPLFNSLFALGEELGWRGFLLPELLPLGQWRAVLLSGVIWGVWHAPAIWQGHNYPTISPWAGVLLMVVFTVLAGVIMSWLYLETRSPWAPALGHGALNAVASLPLMFLVGVDISYGGTLASVMGCLALALFVGWLVLTKRFPVRFPVQE